MSYYLSQLEGEERKRECEKNDALLRRAVPYNTGKVAIGIAYIPSPAKLTADQERMQAALLDGRTMQPQSMFQRVLGRFWQWV